MELILITHGCGTAFQITDITIVVAYDESTLKLTCSTSIDTEIGTQLHRATHSLGNIHKGSVTEDCRVECRKEIILVRNHRTQILAHQFGMIPDRLTYGAEYDTLLLQFLPESGLHAHRVHDRIHGHAAQSKTFLKGDAQLIKGLYQFGVHLLGPIRRILLRGVGII